MKFNTDTHAAQHTRPWGNHVWALNPKIVACWKAGRLEQVPPVTLEFAPTLCCPLRCIECPYRQARLSKHCRRLALGELATPDDVEARNRLADEHRRANKRIPDVMVSLIFDKTNASDLVPTAKAVADVYRQAAKYRGNYDDLIIRPPSQHGRGHYKTSMHETQTINAVLDAVGPGGEARTQLEDAGMNCKLGFGLSEVQTGKRSSYTEVLEEEYTRRKKCGPCLANGLFLTVGPDARTHLCVDRNCDEEWVTGDLKTQSVREIYGGEARQLLLERVHACDRGPQVCEATCRIPRLDHIAHQIRAGTLTDTDVAECRRTAEVEPKLLLS